MSFKDEIVSGINKVIDGNMEIRNGVVVPELESITLFKEGVKLDATFLYVDLADSTGIVNQLPRKTAAEIIKCFLYCMSRVITRYDGVITSFDGDRVMGVYVEGAKNTNAAKSALKMKYIVRELIQPKLESTYQSVRTNNFEINHCVGIDTGEVYAVRAGIRDSNDLIWIGKAPNIAAKLSEMRVPYYQTFITEEVYDTC